MIFICEPVCIGFEHAQINSLFIEMLKMVFEDDIIFLGEKTHLENVENILDSDKRVIFQPIDVPPRGQSRAGRFRMEYRLTKELFNQASVKNADFVIFISITSSILASIKICLRKFKSLKVLTIPHSELDFITQIPLSRDLIFWFKWWMKYFNSSHLKYLLLGLPLKDELTKEIPEVADYIEYINFPIIFKNSIVNNLPDKGLKFGFLGVGSVRKGLEDFIKLSQYIKTHYPNKNASFILAGHLIDEGIRLENGIIEVASNKPLDEADYYRWVNEIDYVIFLHKPEYYRFTASGVFIDAISCLKPVIAIKNPFIQYYFDIMGDIGYLCDDYQEMRSVIEELIKKPDPKRYKQQQLNIMHGREKFSPENIADRLKNIFNNF